MSGPRRLLLLAGACGACWIVPLLIPLLAAGWAGALGAGAPVWLAILATGVVLVAILRRRRRAACGCTPA